MYFAPGAGHAPHHVPKEWADKSQGQVRRRVGCLPRARVQSPEGAGHRPEGRRALAPRPRRAGLEHPLGRREEAVRPHDGGLCRIPESHGPSLRPAVQLSEDHRSLGEHTHHVHLRQWSQLGRRSHRVGEREQVLQQRRGLPAAEPRDDRRAGRADDVQPLRLGLDVRGQHAVQALEARDLPWRHQRSVHRPLAEGHQGERGSAHPVRARD